LQNAPSRPFILSPLIVAALKCNTYDISCLVLALWPMAYVQRAVRYLLSHLSSYRMIPSVALPAPYSNSCHIVMQTNSACMQP